MKYNSHVWEKIALLTKSGYRVKIVYQRSIPAKPEQVIGSGLYNV